MCSEYFSAIIGVAGTVIGTLLGFILGKMNLGRLHFDFSFKDKIENGFACTAKNKDGSTYQIDFNDIGKRGDEFVKLEYLNLEMDIKIYNSSERDNVISDLKIALMNNKNILITEGIIDPASVKHSHVISTGDFYKVLNIPSKQAVNVPVKVSFFVGGEIDKCTSIVFCYKDKKFREQRKTIMKLNLLKIMEGLKV